MQQQQGRIRCAVRQCRGEHQSDVPPDVWCLGSDRRLVAAFVT